MTELLNSRALHLTVKILYPFSVMQIAKPEDQLREIRRGVVEILLEDELIKKA